MIGIVGPQELYTHATNILRLTRLWPDLAGGRFHTGILIRGCRMPRSRRNSSALLASLAPKSRHHQPNFVIRNLRWQGALQCLQAFEALESEIRTRRFDYRQLVA